MKTVLLLLLALFFVAHGYKDLRAEYSKRSVEHRRLSQEYYAQYKKYVALANQYRSQARRFTLTSKSHRFSARKYRKSAEVHLRAERRFHGDFVKSGRKSAHHLRAERKFAKLALHYEELARRARARARHHLDREHYYLGLSKRFRVSYEVQRRDRLSDLKKRDYENKLAREFFLKARDSRKRARAYELDSQVSLKKTRNNKRLARKYGVLHRRAVYQYNFRLHKRRYRVHRLKRRQDLKRARFNRQRAEFYYRNAVKNVKSAKYHARVAERLNGKISLYRKEIAQIEIRIQRLQRLVLLNKKKAEEHRRKAASLQITSRRHRQQEQTYLKLASRERLDALKERKIAKRWFDLYKSTFVHRRRK